jgi:hypothetical protein
MIGSADLMRQSTLSTATGPSMLKTFIGSLSVRTYNRESLNLDQQFKMTRIACIPIDADA